MVRQGGVALHREQTNARQHGKDHLGNFTQVWVAVRRKILLLLWRIDLEKVVVVCSTLARQRLPQAAASMHVRGCELAILLTLSTVSMGLIL